jgi:NifB/MoaA-like Fe-S oxidoreductase
MRMLRYLTTTGYVVAALTLAALLAIVQCAGCERQVTPEPLPTVTIYRSSPMLQAEVERLTAELEACHKRIDKVIDAVGAIAPAVPGRMRAPRLLEEARR